MRVERVGATYLLCSFLSPVLLILGRRKHRPYHRGLSPFLSSVAFAAVRIASPELKSHQFTFSPYLFFVCIIVQLIKLIS